MAANKADNDRLCKSLCGKNEVVPLRPDTASGFTAHTPHHSHSKLHDYAAFAFAAASFFFARVRAALAGAPR